MRTPARRHLITYITVVACWCLLAPAGAAADTSLTISPPIIDLSAKAGDTQQVVISVTAAGDVPLTITFQHADFGLTDGYGIQQIEDDAPETTSFSTREWFSVPKTSYQVSIGETLQLPVTVKVPPNTPGGTHLGIARIIATPPATGAQIQIPVASGALLFIAVDGGSPPKAHIDRFELPGLVQSGPIEAQLRVANHGDEFFSLTGTLTVDGRTKSQLKIGQQYVVPGQPRNVQLKSGGSPKGANQLKLGRGLGFGRHTVQLRLRIAPTNATVVSTRTFWVVPVWAWIVGGLLALLLIGAGTWLVLWLLARRARAVAKPAPAPVSDVDAEAGDFDDLLGVERDAVMTDHDVTHIEPDPALDHSADTEVGAGVDPLLEGFDQIDGYDENSDEDN